MEQVTWVVCSFSFIQWPPVPLWLHILILDSDGSNLADCFVDPSGIDAALYPHPHHFAESRKVDDPRYHRLVEDLHYLAAQIEGSELLQ